MYLKQIITQGFKSFADKINLDFEDNITAIVGPNGSGKSNIVDAVRWVLGEQSIKNLRGLDSMTDVIFSGSKSRNPASFASVTLVFDNNDKHLKTEYTEVSIKRTVYKNGDNEYYLNNERCRLKDILNLLVDSGACRDSFNIISQGDISSVLSSKPEERRVIFESAAGVLKYKKRKEDAIKKLNKTHDNIDRINDIINELEIQIEPLQKQKENAQIYIKTKEDLEKIEIELISYDIENLNNEKIKNKTKQEEINKNIFDLNTNINIHNTNLEKKKSEYETLNEKLNDLQKMLLNQITLVEKLNSDKKILIERKKYEVSDSKIHFDIIFQKEQQEKLKNQKKSITEEIKLLEKQIIETNELINENNNLKEKTCFELNELKTKIDIKSRIFSNTEYKINYLEDAIKNNSDMPYSVKTVLNSEIKGIHNVIGKLIEVEEKYSTAIDIALGYSSLFVVCDDEFVAQKSIDFLKQNNYGRATFFPMTTIQSKNIDISIYEKIKNEKGFIDIASNIVNYNLIYKNIVLNQLGNILVVDNIESANKISKITNHKYRVVTLEGEILHVGGSITGGAQLKKNSLILEKIELEKYKNTYIDLLKNIKILEEELEKLKKSNDLIIEKSNNLNSKKHSLNQIFLTKNNIKEEIEKQLDDIYNSINNNNVILNNGISSEEEKIIQKYYEELSKKENIIKEISDYNVKIDDLKNEISEIEHNQRQKNQEIFQIQKELKEIEMNIFKEDVKIENLLNVLNEEYGMTFEKAKKEYILTTDEKIARKKVNDLRKKLKEIGMVNLDSINEFEKVNERYNFLNKQKSDLFIAENTLSSIISEMDIVMKENFLNTFKIIQYEFKKIFKELFNGGDAELKLTDPSNVLETGIEINALPPGKKLQHISLLSGGEKALTAISLLFAILKTREVPFCLLDEVEAPLDEVNVETFGKFLRKFEEKTQFIVITHKKKTMEYADTLYGITMQESGVSKLVSVKLNN